MTLQIDRRGLLGGATAAMALAMSPSSLAAPRRFFSPQGARIGLQLYTLGDEWSKDPVGVFAELAKIGISDIELPGLNGRTAAELRAAADGSGLKFSSMHLPAAPVFDPKGLSLKSTAAEIAAVYNTLGATNAVVPLAPLPAGFKFDPGRSGADQLAEAMASTSVDGWKRFAAELNAKGAELAAHGITLCFHNHNVEFAALGKTTPWQILVEETDPERVFFELDLGWVSAAGLDPVTELRRLGRRVRWLHVKDVKPSTRANFALKMDPSVVGEGRLHWPRILRAAAAVGVRHYYLEQEPPFTMPRLEAVRRGHDFLARQTLV